MQVGPRRTRAVERGLTVADDVDLVALALQRAGQGSGDRRVVLDEQHRGHVATVRPVVGVCWHDRPP